ncbi:hypothetical protein FJV41_46275 [Myxococcus llanfairpwllgwyngyllgogerychwyrndrobwllllantysiliogogogochensis]|uniref:Lipoprotein n=1 Tax=Myxococcus llanfairpwllgwyngyllgogerychwyrndrobwllllantysiliogogogochensis TaxID=2590453 RepID=A0A540WJD9_9BACT|nr:hypothetical protein [Myxococcus llanfairpwllgwyngyllgogerychwyrndrobwllllantysiliogogogochensis]TQF09118.1 hypothetical protein FJV41_46275 [Myxococcus llanfairpwllgwyngyllgogerychwyrndrobwllllantysiliogogogochensis]
MANQRSAVLYAAGWALLLGACGPALDDEASEYIEPPTAESPSRGDTVAEEDNAVSQATFGGHLGSALGSPVMTFNSCTANNEWRTTCGSGASPDMAYTWTVPVTGSYAFSTGGSPYDTVLEIRHAGDTGVVYACNDDRSSGGYTSHVVLRDLPKGRKLLVIIDGYEGDCGVGRLNIVGI